MRKIVGCLLFSGLTLLSCKREKLDLPEPLQALTKTNDCTCEPYIDKYLRQNKTVFIFTCGGPSCDCIVSYYDQQGQKLTMDSSYYFAQFQQDAQLVKHVWRCRPF